MGSGDLQDFLSRSDVKPLLTKFDNSTSEKRLRSNLKIFFVILRNAPINVYQLYKVLHGKPSYTQIKRLIKDLEYVGLIATRVILTGENRAEKQIIVPEEIVREVEHG